MTYDLKASFGYQLSRAARAVERGFEEELKALDLTRLQWCLLLGIGQDGITQPSGLSEHFGLDRAAVSRGLTRLEKQKYLRRVVCDQDARNRLLVITDEGRVAMQAGIDAAERNAEQVLLALRPRERIRVVDLLAAFNDAQTPLDKL
ncbi:DNA-binding transcriptional regulator, MarR family [Monaibacterium marinum]|uniref:DNA-binding transcriptional regulator, MarR family n=1 Tax=Pontivivens marinum TaxID=1690039 RepID=A0A2C9CVA5_9RHOB|nr:MarR family transcriptional regulator [Monaibacterium marinum]SOH95045.1 DNA-binding transcriptional regulator, MarR family [Monaibacterium marinum]